MTVEGENVTSVRGLKVGNVKNDLVGSGIDDNRVVATGVGLNDTNCCRGSGQRATERRETQDQDAAFHAGIVSPTRATRDALCSDYIRNRSRNMGVAIITGGSRGLGKEHGVESCVAGT